MAKNSKGESAKSGNGASLGFEATLWQAADKMRGHMDAAEYKHVALGRPDNGGYVSGTAKYCLYLDLMV